MDARVKTSSVRSSWMWWAWMSRLFFQANPATFDTACRMALRLHRHAAEISRARSPGDGRTLELASAQRGPLTRSTPVPRPGGLAPAVLGK